VPALKNPRFWGAQVLVIAVPATHQHLERLALAAGNPIDFLPIALLWLPLIYTALTFGFAGSIASSLLALLASSPTWLVMQNAALRWEEILTVVLAAAASSLIGRQVDSRREAQRTTQAYAEYAVRSHEEERRQLSLDLHDDSIQTLASACHELDILKDSSSSAQSRLPEVRRSVADVIQRLRDVSVALHPPVLDDMGVVSALRGLLADYEQKGIFVGQLAVTGEQRRLPQDRELTIFRIAQEALRNIVRHGKATRVRVGVAFAVREVVLEVVDDGIGFDVLALRNQGGRHMGLLSMKERAEMIGGRLELSSKPGKGTRVTARLPLFSRLD